MGHNRCVLPDRAAQWAADVIGRGSRITSVRRLRPGGWHVNHAVAITDRHGHTHRLVLRRWARPGWPRVAYLVFNTIMNLTTQAVQVACFRNVAAHLEPGGRFVIEVAVPDLRRLPPGQNAVPFEVGQARWAFDVYDTATQEMSSNYIELTGGRGEYTTIPFRYVSRRST